MLKGICLHSIVSGSENSKYMQASVSLYTTLTATLGRCELPLRVVWFPDPSITGVHLCMVANGSSS